MIASFSVKHAAMLLLALILIAALWFVFLRDEQASVRPATANVLEQRGEPVQAPDYAAAVINPLPQKVEQIEQYNDVQERIREVEAWQQSLQDTVITRENQQTHLQLILKLAQIKKALQDGNVELADQLLEEIKQIQ